MLALLVSVATLQGAGNAPVIIVSNADAAASVHAPVSIRISTTVLFPGPTPPATLRLQDLDEPGLPPVPAQFVPDTSGASTGRLWWLMPAGDRPHRRFRVAAAPAAASRALRVRRDDAKGFYDVTDNGAPVLRYNQGTVPVPAGIPTRYARGDYLHPVYGLDGEVLTADYPKDHPHHRGISWSWPVTRWNDQVRDIWAVVGVWSRPASLPEVHAGPVLAQLEADNVWKWGDQTPLVREHVRLRVFHRGGTGRFVDVEIRLLALQEGVAIGGRPHAGYGGFGLRAAPATGQTITLHTEETGGTPRRSWLDYSGVFAGGKGVAGIAIFEHPTNPGYPNGLLKYPSLNYVMPAFPGPREVVLSRRKPLVLRHRLWIHAGVRTPAALAAAWAAYAQPPQCTRGGGQVPADQKPGG